MTPAANVTDLGSSPTRIRTRNFRLEAGDDFRFTIEPFCKAEGEGVEPSRHHQDARPASNRIPSPIGLPFRNQRSVRELNPVFVHTTDACCRNTYRPFVLVITDGIEPSVSCLSRRRLRRWTTRSCFLDEGSSRDRSRTCKITSLSCLPLCLFAHATFVSSGSGGRTRRSWLMRPG